MRTVPPQRVDSGQVCFRFLECKKVHCRAPAGAMAVAGQHSSCKTCVVKPPALEYSMEETMKGH
eukprot:2192813-Amphidinium_carterae.1